MIAALAKTYIICAGEFCSQDMLCCTLLYWNLLMMHKTVRCHRYLDTVIPFTTTHTLTVLFNKLFKTHQKF